MDYDDSILYAVAHIFTYVINLMKNTELFYTLSLYDIFIGALALKLVMDTFVIIMGGSPVMNDIDNAFYGSDEDY